MFRSYLKKLKLRSPKIQLHVNQPVYTPSDIITGHVEVSGRELDCKIRGVTISN